MELYWNSHPKDIHGEWIVYKLFYYNCIYYNYDIIAMQEI